MKLSLQIAALTALSATTGVHSIKAPVMSTMSAEEHESVTSDERNSYLGLDEDEFRGRGELPGRGKRGIAKEQQKKAALAAVRSLLSGAGMPKHKSDRDGNTLKRGKAYWKAYHSQKKKLENGTRKQSRTVTTSKPNKSDSRFLDSEKQLLEHDDVAVELRKPKKDSQFLAPITIIALPLVSVTADKIALKAFLQETMMMEREDKNAAVLDLLLDAAAATESPGDIEGSGEGLEEDPTLTPAGEVQPTEAVVASPSPPDEAEENRLDTKGSTPTGDEFVPIETPVQEQKEGGEDEKGEEEKVPEEPAQPSTSRLASIVRSISGFRFGLGRGAETTCC